MMDWFEYTIKMKSCSTKYVISKKSQISYIPHYQETYATNSICSTWFQTVCLFVVFFEKQQHNFISFIFKKLLGFLEKGLPIVWLDLLGLLNQMMILNTN